MILNAEQLSEWKADEGIRRLIAAIIIEAAHTIQSDHRKQTEKLLHEKSEAREWFFANAPDQAFSFSWCCAMLGKNPDRARARLFRSDCDIEDTRP